MQAIIQCESCSTIFLEETNEVKECPSCASNKIKSFIDIDGILLNNDCVKDYIKKYAKKLINKKNILTEKKVVDIVEETIRIEGGNHILYEVDIIDNKKSDWKEWERRDGKIVAMKNTQVDRIYYDSDFLKSEREQQQKRIQDLKDRLESANREAEDAKETMRIAQDKMIEESGALKTLKSTSEDKQKKYTEEIASLKIKNEQKDETIEILKQKLNILNEKMYADRSQRRKKLNTLNKKLEEEEFSPTPGRAFIQPRSDEEIERVKTKSHIKVNFVRSILDMLADGQWHEQKEVQKVLETKGFAPSTAQTYATHYMETIEKLSLIFVEKKTFNRNKMYRIK